MTRGREVDLARFCFGDFDQLLHAACGKRRVHQEHVGRHGELRHRREIPDRVERRARIQAGARDEVGCGEQQGVAVGRCVLHDFRADVAGRAWPVVGYDLLAEPLAELLRDDAADGIRCAARRLRNNETHRTLRIHCIRCMTRRDRAGNPSHCTQVHPHALHLLSIGAIVVLRLWTMPQGRTL